MKWFFWPDVYKELPKEFRCSFLSARNRGHLWIGFQVVFQNAQRGDKSSCPRGGSAKEAIGIGDRSGSRAERMPQ